jgi:WD40 repeat protein
MLEDKSILSGSSDKIIRLWDSSRDYMYVRIIEGHNDAVVNLKSSDSVLISSSFNGIMRLLDMVNNYQCICVINLAANLYCNIVILPNDNLALPTKGDIQILGI